MRDHLCESEHDREAHRSHIATLAGFSFAALLALLVVDSGLQRGFRLAIVYLFISFISYLAALNLQGYKSTRFEDQFATALAEVGSFGLVLAVVAVLQTSQLGAILASALAVLAVVVWGADHLVRVRLQYYHLSARGTAMPNEKRPESNSNHEKKELTFLTCPKHGTRFPKGSHCPHCDRDRRA